MQRSTIEMRATILARGEAARGRNGHGWSRRRVRTELPSPSAPSLGLLPEFRKVRALSTHAGLPHHDHG